MPSWALLDMAAGHAELRRTAYDNLGVMARLRALGWDDWVVGALDKEVLASPNSQYPRHFHDRRRNHPAALSANAERINGRR